MATIVLTAVGTAFGGPLGGAIGAMLGQRIDQELFAPKARHGPRLGELAVQTSTYGTALPKLFGTMRVAGTVIWATDLRERKATSGGGKGRPKTVSYSYSANLAVALSARPLRAVKRIWADGKLLRGAAGDFKTPTAFRFYTGDEDQAPDPLIVSVEGVASAPAHRGLAYAVFEDFHLEDYGNRIPSLSFEVEADGGSVALGDIAAALSGGSVSGAGTPPLLGFAASGDSVRGVLEAVAEVVPLSVADDGAVLTLRGAPGAASAVSAAELTAPPEIARRAEGAIAGEVSLVYYERGRDYQTGLQRAFRSGPVQKVDRLALAAALSAGGAKAMAERKLAALWAGRETAKAAISWRRLDLRPGDAVTLGGVGGKWRILRRTIGPARMELELARAPAGSGPDAAAVPGRAIGERDVPHGPSVLRLIDLPLDAEGRPHLFALVSGTSSGWRRAGVMLSMDGGASWSEAGGSAEAAVLGHALTALAPGGSTLIDLASEIEVALLHEEMLLESRDVRALDGGANLALIGAELVQFGEALEVAPGRYRLRRLLRGRRGTEWAAAGHVAGEAFSLLRPESLLALPVAAEAIGSEAQALASGVGDGPGGVAATAAISGEALRPPAPVHLRGEIEAGGDLVLSWVRRSRQGWSWPSGADTPLAEERELYRVTIGSGAHARTFETTEPRCRYGAGEQAADGAAPPFAVAVRQIGTFAASRPAEATIG